MEGGGSKLLWSLLPPPHQGCAFLYAMPLGDRKPGVNTSHQNIQDAWLEVLSWTKCLQATRILMLISGMQIFLHLISLHFQRPLASFGKCMEHITCK
ncbi:uncharacterized protein LOC111867262 isoform X2 [Cryptotermes secundus]|uniref:uncharacterized protein LOC111867262 isoform X2 n=1 Tax=Cryptotermes secundus TaxID=105785 RepID=UPI001454C4F5|nr:uncharacterized protein LOC111867262 isoform X2 [Cryptotermes secundus]